MRKRCIGGSLVMVSLVLSLSATLLTGLGTAYSQGPEIEEFMLLPGENTIVLCPPDEGFVESRKVTDGNSASVVFKICPEAASEIADPEHTSLVYMVPTYNVGGLQPGDARGRVPVAELVKQPGVSFAKRDGMPIGPAGISMIEAAIGENFPAQRFMLFPGENTIVLCPPAGGHVESRNITDGSSASVIFKICPEAAAGITEPEHTSLVYMIPTYEVGQVYPGEALGRVPVAEMVGQPGVSFVKRDGIPIGQSGISLIEAAIGESFPAQRFMLFPGENTIVLCPPDEGYVESRKITDGNSASVLFKICPEAASEITDPEHTSVVYMVPTYRVGQLQPGDARGRVPMAEIVKQPGVSFAKRDDIPIGPAGISMIEVTY